MLVLQRIYIHYYHFCWIGQQSGYFRLCFLGIARKIDAYQRIFRKFLCQQRVKPCDPAWNHRGRSDQDMFFGTRILLLHFSTPHGKKIAGDSRPAASHLRQSNHKNLRSGCLKQNVEIKVQNSQNLLPVPARFFLLTNFSISVNQPSIPSQPYIFIVLLNTYNVKIYVLPELVLAD